MTPGVVMDVVRDLLWTACLVAGPLLLAGLVVGVVMGVLQSATQVQEASLTFVPKLVALGAVIVMGGPWAMHRLVDYTSHVIVGLADLAPRGRG